jgi:hypothetical protein
MTNKAILISSMKTTVILAFSLATLLAFSVQAKDSPKANPFRGALSEAPTAELPAKAAQLVKHAKARDWGTTTVDVVKAALEINPAAAPSIVSAIAKAVPEMASVAAGTAAAEQPNQATAIARAAAAAAPSKAGKIVAAVCRAVPGLYQSVAMAAAQVAPSASIDILNGVGDAIPALKPSIDGALGSYSASIPSVNEVIMQAKPFGVIATTALLSPSAALPGSGSPIVGSSVYDFRAPGVRPPQGPPLTNPASFYYTNAGTVNSNGLHYVAP